MLSFSFLSFVFALVQLTLAAALPAAELLDVRQADSQCVHGPSTRSCWGNGFSVATNYDARWPVTGKTVKYFLEVQNSTAALDGVPRIIYNINGQYPGPLIRATWGDTLEITVKNSLTNNGTSMHWHGLRQWQTNDQDGVGGITECPIPPGEQRVYKFLCTQFGTTWYHSHFSDQYSDGVVGTMIIDGPASSNYDFDLGTYPVNDWYYRPAFEIAPLLQAGAFPRGPPPANNILINGTNVNANGGGRYHRNILQKGKKYRLRLINTSTNDHFQVGLDGHNFTVISADFVPLIPFTTKWISLGIGARYDVIINANQAVDSYWFHVVPQAGCSANLNPNALAIFQYDGATSTTPSDASRTNAPPGPVCTDNNAQLVPWVKLNVPKTIVPQSSRLDVGFAITQNNSTGTVATQLQWNLNFTAIVAPWNKPTLQYVLEGNTSYPKSMNMLSLPNKNEWAYWIIQAVPTTPPPIAHPIHLHGHDFYVLGSGSGIFSDSSTLKFDNPPRRDVAMLPAGGYIVVAFITDNPGAWLMHCHIAWHVGLGLGAQFLERPNDIVPNGIGNGLNEQCAKWNAYNANAIYKQYDSGL